MTGVVGSVRRATGIGAILLATVLLAVAALVFAGIYLVTADHYGALLGIGAIALVLGLVTYLLQSLSSDPVIQRALGWGFGGMGFTLLFLTVLIDPAINVTGRIGGLIVLLLLLAGAIAGVAWRMRSHTQDAARHAHRAEWDQQPAPNAFDYPTATHAVVPPPTASPSPASPPDPPSGGL
ncbi:MAG: hypothetical protein ACREDK_08980 [Thermoplasmata archaeon]